MLKYIKNRSNIGIKRLWVKPAMTTLKKDGVQTSIFLTAVYFFLIFGYKYFMISLADNQFVFSFDGALMSFDSYDVGVVGNILLYVQIFLTQSYNYPALGALIIILLCLPVIFISKKITGNSITGCIFIVGLLGTFQYYNLLWFLYANILFVLLWAISAIRPSPLKQILFSIFIVAAAGIIFIYGKTILEMQYPIYPLKTLVLSIAFFSIEGTLSALCFLFSFSCITLAFFSNNKRGSNKRNGKGFKITAMIIFLISATLTILFYNKDNEKFFKTEYLFRNRDWKTIVSNINDKERKDTKVDFVQASYEKVALLCSGQALEKIFTLPRPNFPSLFPQELKHYEENLYALIELYISTEMYGAALEVLFNMVTGKRSSKYIAKKIIEVSQICGDTEVQKKFEKTFGIKASPQRQLNYKPQTQNHNVLSYVPATSVLLHYNNTSTPPIGIFEYAVTEMLFAKNYQENDLREVIEKMRVLGYKKLPKAIQEAMIIKGFNPMETVSGYRIEQKTLIEKDIFLENERKLSTEMLSSFYGRNYFFYYNYETIQMVK